MFSIWINGILRLGLRLLGIIFDLIKGPIVLHNKYRSSPPPEVFYKKGVLINFTNFTGKHLCQSLFFNKVAGPRPKAATLLKKRLWHSCFPVKFVKFLRTPFLQNTSGSGRLLLQLNMEMIGLVNCSSYFQTVCGDRGLKQIRKFFFK